MDPLIADHPLKGGFLLIAARFQVFLSIGLVDNFRPSRKPIDRDFRGFPRPSGAIFPGHGVALQLHQAAHVVGEVLQPDPRLGPHQYAEGIDTLDLKDAKALLDGLK